MKAVRKKLTAVLDTAAAEGLLQRLLEVRGKPIVIDASAVERLTVPALQVLISGARTWASDDVSFRTVKPSPAFMKALSVLAVQGDEINLEGTSI